MASKIHVKSGAHWKPVKIDENRLLHEDLDGFPGLEILTDYELVTSKDDKKAEKTKQTKKSKSSEPTLKSSSPAAKDNENKKQKKKKRKKKKQGGQQENTSINNDKSSPSENVTNKKNQSKSKSPSRQPQSCTEEKDDVDKSSNELKGTKRKASGKDNSVEVKKLKTETVVSDTSSEEKEETQQKKKDMSAWQNLFVPEPVLRALEDDGFVTPTPIQTMALPSAIRDRMDILGAAETGSGKTLGFGIPILHYIMQMKDREKNNIESDSDESMAGSDDEEDDEEEESELEEEDREEEMGDVDDDEEEEEEKDEQEEDDEDNELENEEEDSEEDLEKTNNEEDDAAHGEEEEDLLDDDDPGIGCVKVIENVDFEWLEDPNKEKAGLFKRNHPLALILEPTRELAIQVKNHLLKAARYTDVTVSVIVGGLSQQKQHRMLKKRPDIIVATPGRLWEMVKEGEMYLSEIEKTRYLVVDEADRMVEKGHFEELAILLKRMNRDVKMRQKRHTFVFSATLTLIHSGPQRFLKKKKKAKLDEKQKLALLIRKIGLSEKPKVIDLSRKVGTVETLTEARINCSLEDKDVLMYYFLKRYPGRTLVFANSKDCIRRLVSVFTLLKCNPLPLHADMHQRQRLKNLDRFTGNPNGLLLASDVAARGLDIPNVQHVLHFQVPQTVENYVHRSGRTARASREGLSVMIIGPKDTKNYRKIVHSLNRSEDLPMFPVDQEYLTSIRYRVNLVRQIETQEYRFKKSKRNNDWVLTAAKEMDIEVEEDMLFDIGDTAEQVKHRQHYKYMKQELGAILKEPILPRGFSSKYPTQSGRLPVINREGVDNDAIKQVRKDKKVQDKLLEKYPLKPKPLQPKKQKWKKKNKKGKGQS